MGEKGREMKGVVSKAMSSPSRGAAAESFPAPLIMRFLRSNVGSKSRGARSRSSPMFVTRKKNAAIETQEPSSPKVTCIGQVRVGRSKNFTSSKPAQVKNSQGTFTCFSLTKCSMCTPRMTNLQRWASLFRFGSRKKIDVSENSSKHESNGRNHVNDGETEVTGNEDKEAQTEEKEENEGVLRGPAPPKNALLLTRSRSAPFRASSLAVQFWGETNNDMGDEVKMTSSCRGFDQQESTMEKQMSRKLRFNDEENKQICAIGRKVEGDSSSGKNMEQVDVPHPLLLTRSKSASASKTEKKEAK